MIISERQIIQLITIARNSLQDLEVWAMRQELTPSAQHNLEVIRNLLAEISDQQCRELKDV
jgi:hypothetical protein